ncbi:fasciclin-like arabinogalactan protein 21 [Primulina tabacum]|uniref:fasciclin-like arabinogalactan protein 21 n=1 Tax=Primulina tabacum TaxID=48773 RepID=UPI003F5A5D73
MTLRFVLLLLIISAAVAFETDTNGGSSASPPPSAAFQPNSHPFNAALVSTILSTLGFQEFSTAAFAANLSTTTPITVFAPSDASLLTCPSCSLPLLLQELSLPGLYPLHFLQTLIFGTKIETLAPNRCLTVTNNDKDKVFVNGVEISHPDLFSNGLVVIHGLQGFVSHLSPVSCDVERMASLSFPAQSLSSRTVPSPSLSIMRLMLKDTILRLRATGYSIASLAMRVKFVHLSELKSITIFALDDVSIFSGEGNSYLSNFRYHVVPNRRLTGAELVSLPSTTILPTMDAENNLVVTTAGGGGSLAPMRINYVKITTIDLLHNSRIVIHGISSGFPHMHTPYLPYDQKGASFPQIERSNCDHPDGERGMCMVEAAVPAGMQSTVDTEGHHVSEF